MNCVFVEIEGEVPDARGWRRVVCTLCQRPTQLQPNTPDRVIRMCKFGAVDQIPAAYRPGLGDRLKMLLERLGITRDLFRTEVGHYVVVGGMHCRLERVTETQECACEWRQEALNRFGIWVAHHAGRLFHWLRRRL